jgi:E3 ubiquitin-protein ligase listerin
VSFAIGPYFNSYKDILPAVLFLSENGFRALLQDLISAFTSQVELVLRNPELQLNFDTPMELLRAIFEKQPHLLSAADVSIKLLPNVVIFCYLLPISYGSQYAQAHMPYAQALWTSWLEQAPPDIKSTILTNINGMLRDLLCDIEIQPRYGHSTAGRSRSVDKLFRPADILAMVRDASVGLKIDPLEDIFPSRSKIDSMLDDLPSDVVHPSLAVLEPLIPPSSAFKGRGTFPHAYDSRGYSSYARIVIAVLQVLLADRKLARENMWALRHILALELFAGDFMHIPSARNPIFNQHVLQSDMTELVSKCGQIATFLLTSSVEDGWHLRVVDSILKDNFSGCTDALGKFIAELVGQSKTQDSILQGRILRNALHHIVSHADKQDAEQWMLLARSIERPGSAFFRLTLVGF